MVRRVLVGYGVDVDAVSGWIASRDGHPANPTNVSRGVFGATVGVDRLLKLFAKHSILCTWFIPGHSIESFPDQMRKIRDAGHEIGLHGYTHELVSTLTEQQERDVLARSIEVAKGFTGKRPKGWTAPAWSTSKRSIKLLEEYGLEYDHSFMHHDSQMYFVPDGTEEWKETDTRNSASASTWMTPLSPLKPSKIVEVPANWHLDDWPPLQPAGGNGYIDPYVIERMWKEQFEYLYREHESFVFPMSIHPQVSGKPQVILMHERVIEFIKGHEGVEFCTFEKMVDEFKLGRFPGVSVNGGTDT